MLSTTRIFRPTLVTYLSRHTPRATRYGIFRHTPRATRYGIFRHTPRATRYGIFRHASRATRHALLSCLLLALFLILPSQVKSVERVVHEDQQAWVVKDYRYEPGSDRDNEDAGYSICSTRCNAMTTDHRNVIDPGGYRYIQVAVDKEIIIPLNSKLIGGQCVCTADEYVIKFDNFDR